VLAPRNPLVEVVTFHFVAQRSEPRISMRIRLAEPQYVLAVAEMNDDALLMTETWVEVATTDASDILGGGGKCSLRHPVCKCQSAAAKGEVFSDQDPDQPSDGDRLAP